MPYFLLLEYIFYLDVYSLALDLTNMNTVVNSKSNLV